MPRSALPRVAAVAALAPAAALLLAACGGAGASTSEPAAPQARGPTPAGAEGVTVALPAGWYETEPYGGPVVDPVTRLVVSSSPIRAKQSSCQIAAYDFAEDAVALVVVEWREPAPGTPPRPDAFTARELEVRPAPALECFDGPGGSAQFVDRGRALGAYLLVGRRAPESLIAAARAILDTLRVLPPAPSTLARNGYAIDVPRGWDGRILWADPAGANGVLLQVANFELPANDGLEPPRELPPGEEDPIEAMGEGDVLVTVATDAAAGRPTPERIAVADLTPVDATRTPRGHTVARGSFCSRTRCATIEVDFGRPPPPELIERVDEVLASIALRARR